MDEGLSRAVQTIFKRLYDDDLIYRAERIINWCPRDLTALSDIEVDHADEDGELISIRYGSGEASVVVATTRPETMLGDTAVAVHPDDERYRHLIGAEVTLPLTNRSIPIIADEHVDPAFGTGAVKVTPAHDPNDFEIGRRHNLPMPTIMDERAVITAPGPYAGLDRIEARYAIVAALREDGRIVAETRPYRHAVGHCSRCDTIVEPRLSACSGGCGSSHWPRRRARPSATGALSSSPPRWPAGTSSGWMACATGASAGSCGGVTGSRSGTHPTGRGLLRPGRDAAGRLDPGRGRARHLVLLGAVAVLDARAGPTTPRTCAATTRRTCWSPATTSSSSGSCA